MLWRVFGGGVGNTVSHMRLGKWLETENLKVFIAT